MSHKTFNHHHHDKVERQFHIGMLTYYADQIVCLGSGFTIFTLKLQMPEVLTILLLKCSSPFYCLLICLKPLDDIKLCSLVRCHVLLHLDPVVQSIVSLTSLIVVKMLTVLVSTISNSQVVLLKNVSSFCKFAHFFFSKNISVYAIFNDQS